MNCLIMRNEMEEMSLLPRQPGDNCALIVLWVLDYTAKPSDADKRIIKLWIMTGFCIRSKKNGISLKDNSIKIVKKNSEGQQCESFN